MAYNSLADFVQVLQQQGELKRVTYPVRADLEITEIADRVMKRQGPALLFENVIGKQIPVDQRLWLHETNGARPGRRRCRRNSPRDRETRANQAAEVFQGQIEASSEALRLAGIPPKVVKDGPCQEVIHREPDLNLLPVLTCWPGDAGPFITLPTVFPQDPGKGTRNVGLYRMQVYDARTTGMHWHLHKVGARHYHQNNKRTRWSWRFVWAEIRR